MLVNLRRNSTSAGKKTTIYNTSAYSRFQQSHPDRQIRRIIKRIDMRTKRKEKKKRSKIPRPAARDQSDFTTFLRQILITCTGSQRLTTTKKDLAQVQKFLLSPSNKDFVQRKKKTLHFVLGLFAIRSAHFGTWYSASPRTRPPTLGIARKK